MENHKVSTLHYLRSECSSRMYFSKKACKGLAFYAQYREVVLAGRVRCHVRTTRDLVEELRRAEFDDGFISPVIASVSGPEPYRLFWDDIEKLKLTDLKTEVLFDLVDSLYRQMHGVTVMGNLSMRDLVEKERMHPAIVCRLDHICRIIEV